MKFIALPVTQGDAFYAETDHSFRVLVDGGRSRRGLPDLFRRYTKADRVDVLVCTHNDADHAEGVIGFLESGLHCGELWLPATWLDALNTLPSDAHETLEFLWEHFLRLGQDRLLGEMEQDKLLGEMEGDVQEAAWRAVFPELQEERPLEGGAEEASAAQDAIHHVSLSAALGDVLVAIDKHLRLLSSWPFWYGDERDILFYTVLNDTWRLLKLARLALDQGMPIRCFRHDPRKAASIAGCPLIPLSGRPVRYIPPATPRRTAKDFLRYLALTTVNRKSLVCYLDGGSGQPGVLFTADSDLRDVSLQGVREGSIATAPHHGSRDNRDAYARVCRPMVWVRSDGYSKSRPCSEYLSAPGQRFCTLCRNSGKPKQAVRLYTRTGRWVRRSTRPCQCR